MAIPVSLEDAKRQLRQAGEALDPDRQSEIEGFIADAAGWVERYTGHILIARNVDEQFPSFDRLELCAWPIKPDAALTVGFVDGSGAAISVGAPRLSLARRPALALPAAGTRWPPVGPGTITVTVRAGYEAGDIVPRNLRRAMLVLIAAYDADREGGEILAKAVTVATALCREFRRRRL